MGGGTRLTSSGIHRAGIITPTNLPQFPHQLAVGDDDDGERQDEAGAEEGDDVAVVRGISRVPARRGQGSTQI